MIFKSKFNINKKEISFNSPTYFIADIAANHDGSFDRVKKLVYLAKECEADAIKFQHFLLFIILFLQGYNHLVVLFFMFFCFTFFSYFFLC